MKKNKQTNNLINNYIIDATKNGHIVSTDNSIESRVSESLESDFNVNWFSQINLRFKNSKTILIPKKVEFALRNYVPKEFLLCVDKDLDVAIEKCLIVLSNLSITFYAGKTWKCLYSDILHEQTRKGKSNTYVYPKALSVLKRGTSQEGPIIEVKKDKIGKEVYRTGANGSKQYRIAEKYSKAGLVPYTLKCKELIQRREEILYNRLEKMKANPITSNLLNVYSKVELPTHEAMLAEAKRLIKDKYFTKKGKKLTMRNNNKNSYWKDASKRSFVEDNIKLFDFLTKDGFIVPIICGEEAGGRVVDAFSLMPSWIRKLCTIDGKPLEEVDYTALHPNIAFSIYGGEEGYLTHEKVAEREELPLRDVKIDHLSYFNNTWKKMTESLVHSYYRRTEPLMLEKIYRDKLEHGYKITSQRMFKKEVEIMTDVIRHLNEEGIYVLYIYDALMCEPKHRNRVNKVMNYYVIKAGVKTKAK